MKTEQRIKKLMAGAKYELKYWRTQLKPGPGYKAAYDSLMYWCGYMDALETLVLDKSEAWTK